MSVDDRIRSALRDQADSFVPPVEKALDRVRARGRRWRSATIAVGVSAATLVAIGGAWAVVQLQGEGALSPAENPTEPASPTNGVEDAASPLRGSITGDVTEPAALAGTWTLTLNGNGTMDIEPPPRLESAVSGALFTADTMSFRTRLFQAALCRGDGTGIYTWVQVGERIEFQAISDICTDRTAFFEEATWVVSTGAGARD